MASLSKIVKSPSQARDLILILVTVAYALGFVLWSVNAWLQGLGWIPIANTQYFIAGFPILTVLFLMYLLRRAGHWMGAWLSANVRERNYLGWLISALALPALCILFLLRLFESEFVSEFVLGESGQHLSFGDIISISLKPWILVVLIVSGILLIIPLSTELAPKPISDKWDDRVVRRFLIPWLAIVCVGFFSIVLIYQLYSQLPQEFGGFRPRRAELHFRDQNISNSLRDALLRNTKQTSEPSPESIEVLVFYADHDRLIVKIVPDPQEKIPTYQLRSLPAYEIRSDAVVATKYLH